MSNTQMIDVAKLALRANPLPFSTGRHGLIPPGNRHHVVGRLHDPLDLLRQRLECPEHFGLIGVPVIGPADAFDLVA